MESAEKLARALEQVAAAGGQDMLLLALDASPDPILVYKLNGVILFANAGVCRLLAKDRQEIMGASSESLFGRCPAPGVVKELTSGRSVQNEETLTILGVQRQFLVKRVPIHDEHGVVIGALAIMHDVTEHRQIRAREEKAREDLERADAIKSTYINTAGHDLAQPLQTMLLAVAALRPMVNERGLRTLARIDQALIVMKTYVEGLLDVSRLRDGEAPIVETFPLCEVIAQLVQEYGRLAEQKGIALHCAETDLHVRADRRLLSRMLSHIVQNAITYTKEGTVVIDSVSSGDHVSVEITDPGIGIESRYFESIFDEHFQINNPSRNSSLGFGMGLHFVRKISQATGYRVTLTSKLGEGSRFAVRVPLAVTAAPPSFSISHTTVSEFFLKPLLVLVDDDELLREMLKDTLEEVGFDILDGASSSAVIEQADAYGRMPAAMVLDYRLLGENGFDVRERLLERYGADIPALLLTGDCGASVRAQAMQLGMRVLTKPVKFGPLRNEITKLIEGAQVG